MGQIIGIILCIAASVLCIALAIFLYKNFLKNAAKLKQDILDEKIGIYRYIFRPPNDHIISRRLHMLKIKDYANFAFVRLANMEDYQIRIRDMRLISYLGTGLYAFPTFPIIAGIFIWDLHLQFQDEKKVNRLEVFEKASLNEVSIEELSNEIDEAGFIIDPLSHEKINPAHICYPRYIKLGDHLFTLKSLIKSFMSHDLESGKLKHPIQDRYLNDSEQKEILHKITSLTGLDSQAILKSFNVFNDASFKITMSLDQKQAYDQRCVQLYKQLLMNSSPEFRILSPADQDQYMALHKKEAFKACKLSNLQDRLDANISAVIGNLT